MFPQKSFVEVLIPSVMLFGDRVLKKIKIKLGHMGQTLSRWAESSYKGIPELAL